jgi:DcuC family C4-dicarboxylate transporter
MEHVGASGALFAVFEKPLKLIKSPYILLGASFLVSQIMVVFVPSHAGLALLLMVTLYPILVRSGVSPMSALGVIGCAQFMDVGPGSGNAILAAQTSGLDVSEYFVQYQLPVFVTVTLVLVFVHMIVQRWWDKKEGWKFDPSKVQTLAGVRDAESGSSVPKIYAILPIIPLFLIICFSKVAGSNIRIDVVTAMVISTVIAIIFELIRKRSIKEVLGSFKLFFEGMGKILVSVVSLIVCGEFFAAGLIKSGFMSTIITAADQAGFGLASMVIVGGALLWIFAFIMGSGNAAFFSFAPLMPDIAKTLGVQIVQLIFPLQILVSFGRVSSPITGAIIAISGLAGVSPFQVAKRTCIPMFVATALTYGIYFCFFYK